MPQWGDALSKWWKPARKKNVPSAPVELPLRAAVAVIGEEGVVPLLAKTSVMTVGVVGMTAVVAVIAEAGVAGAEATVASPEVANVSSVGLTTTFKLLHLSQRH